MAYLSNIYATILTLTGYLTTLFWILALLIIGPWILALVYDILLYLWRSTTYEIPYVGGRARGRRPPRAPRPPSLVEVPERMARVAEGVGVAVGGEGEEVRRRGGMG